MRIKVDNREKKNEHILNAFKKLGLIEVDKTNVKNALALHKAYIINDTCSIGDYCNLDNPNVFIERKAHWDEFAGNCGKNHARFKRELERLDECGGKMYVLVETIQPLAEWRGKRTKMSCDTMQKIINAWRSRHNIEFLQCEKEITGMLIYSLLLEKEDKQWEL